MLERKRFEDVPYGEIFYVERNGQRIPYVKKSASSGVAPSGMLVRLGASEIVVHNTYATFQETA